MAAKAPRRLSREEKELINKAIAQGEFGSVAEFEDFAVRQAIALLRWRELQELPVRRRYTEEEILREARRVRRAVARERPT
jgi:hypothetical protein